MKFVKDAKATSVGSNMDFKTNSGFITLGVVTFGVIINA